jgi:predicted enzyme related to lactoylglutathione lyase
VGVLETDLGDPLSRLPKPSAVVFVANVPRMTQFYQTLASMALLHEDERHAVLELEGFQLVIHALKGAPDTGAAPVGQLHVREDTYIKVCLPVESIAAARTTAARLGGTIRPAASEWEARGFRACEGHDPEGNVLQVRENAA